MGCPAVWTTGARAGRGEAGGGEKEGGAGESVDGEDEEDRKRRRIGSGGGCEMGNYPVYVVKAVRREDVKAGVEFASEHGLRLVVKNTGHDFLVYSPDFLLPFICICNGEFVFADMGLVLGKECGIW